MILVPIASSYLCSLLDVEHDLQLIVCVWSVRSLPSQSHIPLISIYIHAFILLNWRNYTLLFLRGQEDQCDGGKCWKCFAIVAGGGFFYSRNTNNFEKEEKTRDASSELGVVVVSLLRGFHTRYPLSLYRGTSSVKRR